MRKIRLDVETLSVESFSTGGEGTKPGTIRGHDLTVIETCTSQDSNCATCQPGGCPGANTLTCGFGSCGRTNTAPCIEPNC